MIKYLVIIILIASLTFNVFCQNDSTQIKEYNSNFSKHSVGLKYSPPFGFGASYTYHFNKHIGIGVDFIASFAGYRMYLLPNNHFRSFWKFYPLLQINYLRFSTNNNLSFELGVGPFLYALPDYGGPPTEVVYSFVFDYPLSNIFNKLTNNLLLKTHISHQIIYYQYFASTTPPGITRNILLQPLILKIFI